MSRTTVVDPLRDLLGYMLVRASSIDIAQLRQRMRAIALRAVDASVLLVIGANPGITQSKIGRLLDIARPNLVALTAGLLERKLVVRINLDGRSHGIVLTEAGRALAQRARELMKQQEATLLARVPAIHQGAFRASLQALLPPLEVAPRRSGRRRAPGKGSPRQRGRASPA